MYNNRGQCDQGMNLLPIAVFVIKEKDRFTNDDDTYCMCTSYTPLSRVGSCTNDGRAKSEEY